MYINIIKAYKSRFKVIKLISFIFVVMLISVYSLTFLQLYIMNFKLHSDVEHLNKTIQSRMEFMSEEYYAGIVDKLNNPKNNIDVLLSALSVDMYFANENEILYYNAKSIGSTSYTWEALEANLDTRIHLLTHDYACDSLQQDLISLYELAVLHTQQFTEDSLIINEGVTEEYIFALSDIFMKYYRYHIVFEISKVINVIMIVAPILLTMKISWVDLKKKRRR